MVAQDTQEVLEEANQVIEDTLDLMEKRVSWITSNPKPAAAIAALAGIALGSALTYLVASKRFSAKAQLEINEQVAEMKAHYAVTRDKPELSSLAEPKPVKHDPDVVVRDIITKEGYTAYNKVEATVEEPADTTAADLAEEPEPVVAGTNGQVLIEHTNAFEKDFESDHPDTYWDWDEELNRRETAPDEPFVITQTEFNENEDDLNTISLSYYDGDQVLVDEDSRPIENDDELVGAANLLRFGHASGDPNVVYVRNNRLGVLFEITQNDSNYSQAVLGLRHSDDPRIQRRFRTHHE